MIEELDGAPGTIRLLDNDGRVELFSHDLRLIPEPSADPEDPLNWARWRKWLHMTCLTL